METSYLKNPARSAVVLLSGGLDSSVTLAYALKKGFKCHTLSINYGQRHSIELKAARKVSSSLGAVQHLEMPLDLRLFGASALTADIAVPKMRPLSEISSRIPVTYVPARNTIFLALALAFTESSNSNALFLGVNAIDHSGYPDCRREFILEFERLANLATKSGVEDRPIRVHAPLIAMSKSDIIKTGLRLGVDFSLTHSCYDPRSNGKACGACDACQLRLKGFKEAGITDPIHYASD